MQVDLVEIKHGDKVVVVCLDLFRGRWCSSENAAADGGDTHRLRCFLEDDGVVEREDDRCRKASDRVNSVPVVARNSSKSNWQVSVGLCARRRAAMAKEEALWSCTKAQGSARNVASKHAWARLRSFFGSLSVVERN